MAAMSEGATFQTLANKNRKIKFALNEINRNHIETEEASSYVSGELNAHRVSDNQEKPPPSIQKPEYCYGIFETL